MQMRPQIQIKSVIKALTDVVLPAVDPGNKLAQEQGQLAIGLLSLMAQQLPLQFRFDCDELERLIACSSTLQNLARGGDNTQTALTALSLATQSAAASLEGARVSPQDIEQAVRSLRSTIGTLVTEVYRDGEASCRKGVSDAVLALSKAQLLRDRSWLLMQGWEPDPKAIPPITPASRQGGLMSKLAANRPVPLLDTINDGRHSLRDLPLERESIPYVISLPEHGIGTFIYTWVTKDNVAGSMFVAYGPAIGDQPIMEAIDGVPMGPEHNFSDWRVGKLHLRQDLKLHGAQISVTADRIQLEAQFEAAHPAYAYGFHPDGCPDYAATNRLEQAGRIRGVLTVDGIAYEFDTTCARDHSWGTRDWDVPQHWKWLHAQAGPDTCVHFWQINARGQTDLRGYVFRDGRMAEVQAVDVTFEADDQYRQKTIAALVHDTAGRSTRVQGTFFGHFPLIPSPSCTLIEGAMRCEIDGQAGVGWSEFMWPTSYLEYLRKQRQ